MLALWFDNSSFSWLMLYIGHAAVDYKQCSKFFSDSKPNPHREFLWLCTFFKVVFLGGVGWVGKKITIYAALSLKRKKTLVSLPTFTKHTACNNAWREWMAYTLKLSRLKQTNNYLDKKHKCSLNVGYAFMWLQYTFMYVDVKWPVLWLHDETRESLEGVVQQAVPIFLLGARATPPNDLP